MVPPKPEELDMSERTPIIPPVEITVGIKISANERSSFCGTSPGGNISISDDSTASKVRLLILYSKELLSDFNM